MKTVLTLYARVLGQPLLLLRLGGLMMAIIVGYQVALLVTLESLGVTHDQQAAQQVIQQNWLRFALGVVVLVVLFIWLTTMFAVRWHRYALLGQSNYRFLDATFGKRGWNFVWNSFLISSLASVVVFPFAVALGFTIITSVAIDPTQTRQTLLILNGLMILASLPGLYVVGRCSLVFPAIALGFRMRIRDSWNETRGHGLRIFLLLVAMSIPAVVGSEVTVHIVPSTDLPIWLTTVIRTLVGTFFVLITTALWASALSHAYRSLSLPLRPPQPQMSGNA